jgi:Protein of unknown function (DUF1353)
MNITSVSFPKPVELAYDSGVTWKIAAPFEVVVTVKTPWGYPASDLITEPVGFVTDLASVPRVLWSILPPEGNYTDAAAIHDWIYSQAGKLTEATFTRADADRVLLLGMLACGVNAVTARTMWLAVRAFGSGHWGTKHQGSKS